MSNIPAVILVGGLGTRLKSVIGETPKPMVEVGGKPFLLFLIESLRDRGILNIILCVGYKHEIVEEFFGDGRKFGVRISYAIERDLLGTAGAIKNAEALLGGVDRFFVLNGDSFLDFDIEKFYDFHIRKKSDFSFVVTDSGEKHRSGNLILDKESRLTKFKEKDEINADEDPTYINAGIYLVNKSVFTLIPNGDRFSLEYDLVPQMMQNGMNVYGHVVSEDLIDIGTPESLEYFKRNVNKYF